jgi:hypothetical protein
MTAKAKRKRNTAFSTHEYLITLHHPTQEPIGTSSVIGSRDAFHKQTELEENGFLVIVRNVTTDTEEYRSKGLDETVALAGPAPAELPAAATGA